MCLDNVEWYTIWRGVDLLFKIWHEESDEIWPEHLKVLKIFNLMPYFWAKYTFFELKKHRGVIFGGSDKEYKIWRKIDLLFENWQWIWQILTWALKGYKNLEQSIYCWAKEVQRCYVS